MKLLLNLWILWISLLETLNNTLFSLYNFRDKKWVSCYLVAKKHSITFPKPFTYQAFTTGAKIEIR